MRSDSQICGPTARRAANERRGVPGPVLFARYAFPPNFHGYCGPGDHDAFFHYGVAGADDRGLRALAQQFEQLALGLFADLLGHRLPPDAW